MAFYTTSKVVDFLKFLKIIHFFSIGLQFWLSVAPWVGLLYRTPCQLFKEKNCLALLTNQSPAYKNSSLIDRVQNMLPVSYCRLYSKKKKKKKKKKWSGFDNKNASGEVSILDLLREWNTLSLPLLPGSLWPRMIIAIRVLSMGQILVSKILSISWGFLKSTVYR